MFLFELLILLKIKSGKNKPVLKYLTIYHNLHTYIYTYICINTVLIWGVFVFVQAGSLEITFMQFKNKTSCLQRHSITPRAREWKREEANICARRSLTGQCWLALDIDSIFLIQQIHIYSFIVNWLSFISKGCIHMY